MGSYLWLAQYEFTKLELNRSDKTCLNTDISEISDTEGDITIPENEQYASINYQDIW